MSETAPEAAVEASPRPFEIRPPRSPEEFRRLVDIQREVWGYEDRDLVPVNELISAATFGGAVLAAYAPDGQAIGFVYGHLGKWQERVVHVSRMLAVLPAWRGKGVAAELKLAQALKVVREATDYLVWTFDPLETGNAWLNFGRLGATSSTYLVDFYGETTSPLHAGLPTDRIVVEWNPTGPDATARIAGQTLPPAAQDVANGLHGPLVLPVEVDGRGLPHPQPPDLTREDRRVAIEVPHAIREIRDADPALAAAWRDETRAAFIQYMAKRYRVLDVAKGEIRGRQRFFYVLETELAGPPERTPSEEESKFGAPPTGPGLPGVYIPGPEGGPLPGTLAAP